MTSATFEKFALLPGFGSGATWSRYHSWNAHVSPGAISMPAGANGSSTGTSKPEPDVEVPTRFCRTPAASNWPIEFSCGSPWFVETSAL